MLTSPAELTRTASGLVKGGDQACSESGLLGVHDDGALGKRWNALMAAFRRWQKIDSRVFQGRKVDSRTVFRGQLVLVEVRGFTSRPAGVGLPAETEIVSHFDTEGAAAMAVEEGRSRGALVGGPETAGAASLRGVQG